MVRPATRALRALERRIGMSTSGLLTLVVVVAVLFVISLPRLRNFARRENERDALHAAALLAGELPSPSADAAAPRLDELAQELLRQLPDTEVLQEGLLLRRHGYVFALRHVTPPPPAPGVVLAGERDPASLLAVHAWPWQHGPTGSLSFVALPDGRVYRSGRATGAWNETAARNVGPWSWTGWQVER